MCPTCERPVEIDREDTAICSHCDARFATRDARTLVEYTATRHLVKALEDRVPARRGMSPATRWTLTTGVVGAVVAATALFGMPGLVGAGFVLYVLVRSAAQYLG